MAQVVARLTEILQSRPQHEAIDMCNVCMCETIDALGLAGFNKEFNSIKAIAQGQPADLLHVRLQVLVCNLYVMCVSHKRVLCSWQVLLALPNGRMHVCHDEMCIYPSTKNVAMLICMFLAIVRLCMCSRI